MSVSKLPRRLRPTVVVSTNFALELRNLIGRGIPPHDFSIKDVCPSALGLNDVEYRVPPCIAELYEEWARPKGALTHLRLDTIARLALDVYIEERRGVQARRTQLYQPVDERAAAYLESFGYEPQNGKQAGPLFALTDEEAARLSGYVVPRAASADAEHP